ncbi:MAG: T9SS type A sorting domain-containing protein [Bacteroidales bacterium]|nr:T9SS type A sorting domain-containing protein [Bacteroidales bacterium]MDZ4203201.1 T9SS type A sorting domain-containing protein [Bacteroidales bacterium]
MRTLLTIISILLSFMVSSQDYRLFHAGSKKVFAGYPDPDTAFSLTFNSAVQIGTDSVYHNFNFLSSQWITPDTCDNIYLNFVACLYQDRPSWIGRGITHDNSNSYKFVTSAGDTLRFNFNLLTGDSVLFFSDATQRFHIIYDGADTTAFMGFADSSKFYRISHTNLLGNVINSPLHNEKIIIGKALGLIRFFIIDKFPQTLQPLHIVGNAVPEAGFVRLTHEMIYDHQPGDEIQHIDRYIHPGGPTWYNYRRYIKHSYLDRTETQDSIFYLAARVIYDAGANTVTNNTITLKYKKNIVLDETPFERINQAYLLQNRWLYKTESCGLQFWAYSFEPQYLTYCEYDNCWGPFDNGAWGPGPPPSEKTIYMLGLGLYKTYSHKTYSPPYGYSHDYYITYFKKDGIVCGVEVIAGIDAPLNLTSCLVVYPIPAKDYLIIKLEKTSEGTLFISNLNGQELIKTAIKEPATKIDIQKLPPGMYLVKLVSGTQVCVKKIIKH